MGKKPITLTSLELEDELDDTDESDLSTNYIVEKALEALENDSEDELDNDKDNDTDSDDS